MCRPPSILFGMLVVAFGLAGPSPQVLSQESALQGAKVYSSPQAVFDAFRAARDEQDWQIIFSCLTPELRDNEVFEAFFACAMQPSNPKIAAVLKKHGVELNAIEVEYYRRYKAKHDIEIPEQLLNRQNTAQNETPKQVLEPEMSPATAAIAASTGSPDPWADVPPTDVEILRQAVCAAVRNKPAFCGDVNRILNNGEQPVPIGELKHLRVQDDKAAALAKTVLYHYESTSGSELQKVGQEIGLTIRFSKVNGTWYIESEMAEADGTLVLEPVRQSPAEVVADRSRVTGVWCRWRKCHCRLARRKGRCASPSPSGRGPG